MGSNTGARDPFTGHRPGGAGDGLRSSWAWVEADRTLVKGTTRVVRDHLLDPFPSRDLEDDIDTVVAETLAASDLAVVTHGPHGDAAARASHPMRCSPSDSSAHRTVPAESRKPIGYRSAG